MRWSFFKDEDEIDVPTRILFGVVLAALIAGSVNGCGEPSMFKGTLTGAMETNSKYLAKEFQQRCIRYGNNLKTSSIQTEKDVYPTYYLTCTPKVDTM